MVPTFKNVRGMHVIKNYRCVILTSAVQKIFEQLLNIFSKSCWFPTWFKVSHSPADRLVVAANRIVGAFSMFGAIPVAKNSDLR